MRDLQKRKITREYEAVVSGIMTKGGTVDQPMARHATKRTLMAVHPMGNQRLRTIALWRIFVITHVYAYV